MFSISRWSLLMVQRLVVLVPNRGAVSAVITMHPDDDYDDDDDDNDDDDGGASYIIISMQWPISAIGFFIDDRFRGR